MDNLSQNNATDYSRSVNLLSIYMNSYAGILIFLLGCFGNLLNILVLSQRNLRMNSCGWLFLASSVANLVSIIFGLTTRILLSWNLDFTGAIHWMCKLRSLTVLSSRTMAFWLITLASVGRWLSSCTDVRRRHLSTLKNAQRSTVVAVGISCLAYASVLYCYEAFQTDAPLQSYGKTLVCRHIQDATYTLMTVLSPIILMMVFGLMTVSNIQDGQRRKRMLNRKATPTVNPEENIRMKSLDRHLLKMLLIEVVLFGILLIPQAIQKIYSTISDHQYQSVQETDMNKFLYNLTLLLTFTANGIPFYIHTLCGGHVFRKALWNLFRHGHE